MKTRPGSIIQSDLYEILDERPRPKGGRVRVWCTCSRTRKRFVLLVEH